MELAYIIITALIIVMILSIIDNAFNRHSLQIHTSPALGRGYRKYRDELPNGEFYYDNWLTIGWWTFRWYSSK